MSAKISQCGRYRWVLTRRVTGRITSHKIKPGVLLWVMLNPSTADAEVDDATIRKITGFARSWGYREFVVVNLYAYRATDPSELRDVRDPVGAENDAWIYAASVRASMVILGWGNEADPARAKAVVDILTTDNPVLYCLGVNKNGSPKHPLYLKGTSVPEIWEAA
jgi:hypothetical protein